MHRGEDAAPRREPQRIAPAAATAALGADRYLPGRVNVVAPRVRQSGEAMGWRLRAILGGTAWLGVASAPGLGASAAAAEIGLRLELEVSERGASPTAPERWIVWLDGSRLAAGPAPSEGDPPTRRAIFRGAEDRAWLLDPARRSYFQLDPESAEAAAARVAGLRDGVAQGLEMLPPGQRDGLKQLLGDLASPPPAAVTAARLRSRGESARHAGLACTRHDVLEGERRVAELCLAAWGTGPLTRERAAALPVLVAFLRRTLAPLARELPSLRPLAPLAGLGGLDGFPLAVRGGAEPDGRERSLVAVRVEERAVDPALFELPAGYARSLVPPFE